MLFEWIDYTAKYAALIDSWLNDSAIDMMGIDEGWDNYWNAVLYRCIELSWMCRLL